MILGQTLRKNIARNKAMLNYIYDSQRKDYGTLGSSFYKFHLIYYLPKKHKLVGPTLPNFWLVVAPHCPRLITGIDHHSAIIIIGVFSFGYAVFLIFNGFKRKLIDVLQNRNISVN